MKAACANLMPRRRVSAQRVAARLRLWSGLLALYVAVLGVAYASMRATLGGNAKDIQSQLDLASTESSSAETELKRTRAELAAATRTLASAQELRDHPDWSALLQAIASMRGENVVLGSLEVTPDAAQPGVPLTARPSRYALHLTGLARDHGAATSFSLMLERTGVFSRVRLTDTTSQSIGDRQVVAFGMECTMDEAGSDAP